MNSSPLARAEEARTYCRFMYIHGYLTADEAYRVMERIKKTQKRETKENARIAAAKREDK
jgi:hypothetical protein